MRRWMQRPRLNVIAACFRTKKERRGQVRVQRLRRVKLLMLMQL